MHYLLHLPERPWRAIKNGTKKVEGRVYRHTTKYHEMNTGDTILFINEANGEKMNVDVLFVYHYPNARAMLEKEGVENREFTIRNHGLGSHEKSLADRDWDRNDPDIFQF